VQYLTEVTAWFEKDPGWRFVGTQARDTTHWFDDDDDDDDEVEEEEVCLHIESSFK
jgi:hypothetical protein